VVAGDPLSAICRVTIWGRFKSYVSVYPEVQQLEPSEHLAT